jgi:excisionase family DNA binding protein
MDAPTRPGPPRIADERLLLKVPAAARRLDISRSYAYQLARTGELPGVVRLGRSIRVSVRGLEEWVERQRHNGPTPRDSDST